MFIGNSTLRHDGFSVDRSKFIQPSEVICAELLV
jgi:hypothetical protein